MMLPAATVSMSNAPEARSNDTLPGLLRLQGARARQLLAATKAAGWLLEQDSRDDRDTGGWKVPMAQQRAGRPAGELDDTLAAERSPGRAARLAVVANIQEPVRAAATTAAPRRGTA